MAPRKLVRLKPQTLTYAQVQAILHEMGWEPEDAAVFWRLVRRGVGRVAS